MFDDLFSDDFGPKENNVLGNTEQQIGSFDTEQQIDPWYTPAGMNTVGTPDETWDTGNPSNVNPSSDVWSTGNKPDPKWVDVSSQDSDPPDWPDDDDDSSEPWGVNEDDGSLWIDPDYDGWDSNDGEEATDLLKDVTDFIKSILNGSDPSSPQDDN